MASIIFEIGIIIGIAAILGLIARAIKQPPLIAYLITGIVVGPLAFNILKSVDLIENFAHLGIALLLFLVGLSLDFRILKEVRGIAFLAGVGEILVVSAIAFIIAIGFGFSSAVSLYIAAALAFSSAVVVIKLLSDKKETDTLHGKIALGIIIVEHFIAALFLMIIPVINSGSFLVILFQLAKAIFLILILFLFAKVVLFGVLSTAAKNQEILFLLSIGWALIIAALFGYLGFSVEIGALLAGMALAQSPYSLEMTGKIKGLRDFFVVSFFVFFGSKLIGPFNSGMIMQVVAFSLFILIGKPLVVMSFMKFFGYKKKINFLAGISLAQISEMSLILILLGFTLGIVNQQVMSMVIMIALVTIFFSSYSIYYSKNLFNKFSRFLNIFDGKKIEIGKISEKEYDVILFGYNRVGFSLAKAFDSANKKYLVVDYNPKTVLSLSNKGIDCIYGDADDLDLISELPLSKAKVIISTIPELEVNLVISEFIKGRNITFIPTSHNIEDARKLYRNGASYVIMPHFLGGDYMAHLLVKNNFEHAGIKKEGAKQLKELYEREKEGHTHPHKEYHGA